MWPRIRKSGRTVSSWQAASEVELYYLDHYRYKTFLYAFPDVMMLMISDLVTRWEQGTHGRSEREPDGAP